jgi:radical SAM superfamily enzyme YgiQ (UPF0313 family)
MKIGLLAMSGIRACDRKLLELGLTLPGFVERSKVIASLPSLGLLCLAGCTPHGHEVRYFEAESDGSEPREIYDCDLVAISTFSAQVFEAYAIADRLHRTGVKVAMGGLHVSMLPDEAAGHADYVVTGEGERSWPDVVHAAEDHCDQRVFRGEDFPAVQIDEFAAPRFELLGSRPYNRFTVQTSRGCPWRCDFCASTIMLGEHYRKRPVEHVLRDIRAVCQIRENPFIEFADDNTFVDKAWGKELCRRLIPLHLKWFTETDVTVAEDPELLRLMHDAGCRQVLVGLESPDRRALEGVELRANRKAIWADRYADAIRTIQSHGITVNGCFVLGLDRHRPDIFQQVRDFAQQHELYDVQITILTAFPGTPLYSRLKREGRILQDGRWDLCTLFDVNYQPAGMTPQELREGMYWLGNELYSEQATQRRRHGFFQQARRKGASA